MSTRKYRQAVADYCSNNKEVIFNETTGDFNDSDYSIICDPEEWELQGHSVNDLKAGPCDEIALYCPYHDDRFEALLKLDNGEVVSVELNVDY